MNIKGIKRYKTCYLENEIRFSILDARFEVFMAM
jgi:hypothetical protein